MDEEKFRELSDKLGLSIEEYKKDKIYSSRHTKEFVKIECITEIEGTFKEIKRLFIKSQRILILGGNETGKTALGFTILNNIDFLTKRTCYALGFDRKILPRFIHRILNPSWIPTDSAELVDEAGIFLNSRLGQKRSRLPMSSLMMTARQQNDSLIYITQNSAKIDIDALRFCDVLLIKELGMFQSLFERKQLKPIFELSKQCFDSIEPKERVKYFFMFSDYFVGFVKYELPEFWSDKLSNAFKRTSKTKTFVT